MIAIFEEERFSPVATLRNVVGLAGTTMRASRAIPKSYHEGGS